VYFVAEISVAEDLAFLYSRLCVIVIFHLYCVPVAMVYTPQ